MEQCGHFSYMVMGYKQQQRQCILNATVPSFSTTSCVFLSVSAIYEHNDVSWYFPPGPGWKKKEKETKQRKERKSWKGNEASNAVLCSSLLTFTGFDRSMFMNYFRGLLPAWLGCCQKTGWSSSVISDFWWQQRSTEELFRSEVSGTKQTPTGSLTSRPATWLLRANAASNTRESALISVQ